MSTPPRSAGLLRGGFTRDEAVGTRGLGRIYENRSGPTGLRWFWALHAPGGRETLRASNRVATLEVAKAEFETSWKQWKAWGAVGV